MRIIGGRHRGRTLVVPRGLDTRPPLDHQRETVFNILGPSVSGAVVVDLFAGCGSFGLEALSRGAARCIFYERDPRALRALEENIALVGAEETGAVSTADAFDFPAGLETSTPAGASDGEERGVDLVFIDPPYALLSTPGGMARMRALVDRLAPAMAPGGRAVFRIPRGTGLTRPPLGASEQRVKELGKSRVHFVRYPDGPDTMDDEETRS